MKTTITAADIAERLDTLDAEQARRGLELATAKDDLVTLDRKRASVDVGAQLDGVNADAVLRDLSKQRGALLARIDGLSEQLANGRLEREELERRHGETAAAALIVEHEHIAEQTARIDEGVAEHILAVLRLQREAMQLNYRDQDIVASPLLTAGPKNRPRFRATASFALGVPLSPVLVAEAAAVLAGQGRKDGAAA